ncbi:hypothetical protein BOTBODRAFT_328588 [Botryobasidium botryosum FD-172 SS1]|uniref:Uncharacterized protein n=1 Tax=Botryobasidium botryosum (strain FD-172 SS1) TaxID=930990 RepID=A0A067NAE3_BOTB1|nr:hypothetical protein BOTBODRAFT_328588 [Botryobasidium botryosum FD-172 SS1]
MYSPASFSPSCKLNILVLILAWILVCASFHLQSLHPPVVNLPAIHWSPYQEKLKKVTGCSRKGTLLVASMDYYRVPAAAHSAHSTVACRPWPTAPALWLIPAATECSRESCSTH